jgi:hypothetical protein
VVPWWCGNQPEEINIMLESITTAQWLTSPEYRTERDAYYNVELACGHRPADPTVFHARGIPCTTGYGTTQDGRDLCHECCADDDRKNMQDTGKGSAYLVARDSLQGKIYTVTTWPGVQLGGKVQILRRWRDNFGGHRIAFRLLFNGDVWSGQGTGAGMYCRLRRTKLKLASFFT